MTRRSGRWQNAIRDEIHNLGATAAASFAAAVRVEEVVVLDLGADNPLELVFVFLTIGVSLAIMVAFGQWWQR